MPNNDPMDSQAKLEERERLLMEWMRSNESFKTLARSYGKRAPVQEEPEKVEKKPEPEPLDARQEALLDWLVKDEAFKRLTKKFGRDYPKP
jgi:hypothetical protein